MSLILTFLTSGFARALAFLKGLPWYAFVIAALVAIALLARMDARHWHKVADQRAVDAAQWKANAGTLDAALARSNAATAAANAKAVKAQQAAGKAVDAATDARGKLAGALGRADAVARPAKPVAGVCASPAGDKLSEDVWDKI